MTIDEAIEMHERRIKFAQVCICGDCPINECIKEHQLHIEWLRELKKYRAVFKKVGEALANNGFTIDDLDTIFGKVNEEVNADE